MEVKKWIEDEIQIKMDVISLQPLFKQYQQSLIVIINKGVLMLIIGRRKRKLDKRFQGLKKGTPIIPGLPIDEEVKKILLKIGFNELQDGETVLPVATSGPICKFNAQGKNIIHKDRPKETAYRQIEWTWKQWSGYRETETHTKIIDVPYKRYPRTFVPPPGVELSIVKIDGIDFVVAPLSKLNFSNPDSLLHEINIFLELFGRCEILSENLKGFVLKNIKRLNWEILPAGKWPWEKVSKKVKPIIKQVAKGNQPVIKHRLSTITNNIPNFVAVGKAGFHGYLIFGFPKKNLYVLESIFYGNATYVFEENWEDLSKLTKTEILTGKMQKDRIIHREDKWEEQIKELLDS